MRLLSENETVIIDGWIDDETGEDFKDMLWNRGGFLEAVAAVSDTTQPLWMIAHDVHLVPTIRGEETLEEVWKCMVTLGCEQVGTVDGDGHVTGVLLFKDLYNHILEYTEKQLPKEELKKEDVPSSLAMGVTEDARDIQDDREVHRVGVVVRICRDWLENILTSIVVMILLFLDLACLTLGDNYENHTDSPANAVAGTVLLCFVIESVVRLYAYRNHLFDGTRPLDGLDTCVVGISVVVYCLGLAGYISNSAMRGVSCMRLLRLFRLFKLGQWARVLVGRDRKRYTQFGFDLDLTYVTPSVIAMSVPSVGTETHYRNPVEEVARFFHTQHPKKFQIFNLCPERSYDTRLFDLEESDPKNVVAIHCKGGKGRTGTALSTWLLYSKFCETPEDAMDYFSRQRTANKKAKVTQGVTGVSQRRYVRYIHTVFEQGGYYLKRLVLERVVMHTCPALDRDGGCDPWLTVEENMQQVFDWRTQNEVQNMRRTDKSFLFDLRQITEDGSRGKGVEVVGDVKITMFEQDNFKRRLSFYLWFHTGFVNGTYLRLNKDEIDLAAQDKHCKIFKEGFAIELFFTNPTTCPTRCKSSDFGRTKSADQARSTTRFRKVAPASFRVLENTRKEKEAIRAQLRIKAQQRERHFSGSGMPGSKFSSLFNFASPTTSALSHPSAPPPFSRISSSRSGGSKGEAASNRPYGKAPVQINEMSEACQPSPASGTMLIDENLSEHKFVQGVRTIRRMST
eukprot:CAMPEP_0172092988 /NCGR_PEP_ID=MMETSP1043-20130122/25730_1 /TAXON_ID=464988 /ORGANISM="Hemiselmis andersenii, Strain CCMP441" /LENGTH=736 /DNA_ID=CAMNT_0012755735 /DNA_START=27 /DNA_END=2235 /DNA_ORIENTATION=-